MEGQGEILRIEARPADGKRDITVDPATGLITDEVFQDLPEPYRVARYGATPKQVAITFDDGPDPEWTPKILDVLKREACAGDIFPDRPASREQFRAHTAHLRRRPRDRQPHFHASRHQRTSRGATCELELNLTEQLFASRLGIRTILFRPPYSIDQEPDTADQVRPLETTARSGLHHRRQPHRSERLARQPASHAPSRSPQLS